MGPTDVRTASEGVNMTDMDRHDTLQPTKPQEFEFGGLRFEVAFRGNAGATLRVDGRVDGEWKEMLRFDDFVDLPHYHAPASADQINFDRAANGEPLQWYMAQIRDELPEWLRKAGFADVIPTIDMDVVVANLPEVSNAMETCIPESFVRVPGVGLQRRTAAAVHQES
jgi:hypothetical protein